MSNTIPADELFFFTRDMMKGDIYRKYEKAIKSVWNPKDWDYTQDKKDWETLTEKQKNGLLNVTIRFFSGEQAVTNELIPMLQGAHALNKFDWIMYLSTFIMEEAKHAEFLAIWHDEVAGILEPDELAPYFVTRDKVVDPSGRFEIKEVMHEGLPFYAEKLKNAVHENNIEEVKKSMIQYCTLYNGFVEGVLSMPSYEIVVDTLKLYGNVCRTLDKGFKRILADEGRHITFGTTAVRELLQENPEYEYLVHDIFDEFRGTVVGLVEYQKAVPGLDVQKYQTQKVRHYRNRCREMGITPEEKLIEQILDPEIDFVVGVTAG
ncbi:ribonucleotide-diphosphate reductase subunit beta [Siminovitchia sediminis]|uniref:Ribonucleotide-diphosphate reductase subunit beta n=1 Tax=Siminovitchia sediminis TaxID=1274353 RepID=A0ABW4KM26_9BACI